MQLGILTAHCPSKRAKNKPIAPCWPKSNADMLARPKICRGPPFFFYTNLAKTAKNVAVTECGDIKKKVSLVPTPLKASFAPEGSAQNPVECHFLSHSSGIISLPLELANRSPLDLPAAVAPMRRAHARATMPNTKSASTPIFHTPLCAARVWAKRRSCLARRQEARATCGTRAAQYSPTRSQNLCHHLRCTAADLPPPIDSLN